MKEFFIAKSELPREIIFLNGPKLTEPGFRWEIEAGSTRTQLQRCGIPKQKGILHGMIDRPYPPLLTSSLNHFHLPSFITYSYLSRGMLETAAEIASRIAMYPNGGLRAPKKKSFPFYSKLRRTAESRRRCDALSLT
ncbi:hypothetical protein QCA50_007471 [Cerrena zonata]|uniref:Uncharacterized protein n=1 Tax=Cerrena zonata TaxID=2478898 RepID=A0AAW0G8K7_9APHY